MAKRRLISKKVKVLDCNCSWDGAKQAGAHRFDYCTCKVRVDTGKKSGELKLLPDEYIIGTVFIATHPEKSYR